MTPDTEQRSDDWLIAGVAAGQAEAFTALFHRRQADVYRFALHMTGSRALADDVTQDVFLVVIRDAGRYRAGRSTVAAWLCGIARNCARQRLDRDRGLQALALDASDGQVPAVEFDPLSELSRAERVERLRRAVLGLPVRYREVVVLCDLQELSYAEAADAVGCALGTIRSRLHRARGLLAARLEVLEAAECAHSVKPNQDVDRDDRVPSPQSPVPGNSHSKRCLA
ncbi:MAG: RNA polymerase sigma factor [Burkholderiales bacterium]